MKRPPFRDIFWLFLCSRCLLFLVSYIGYILLTSPKYSSVPVEFADLFNAWNHWDAARFTRIAQYGYQQSQDLAFFPLYPLLIKIFAYPFDSWGYMAVGMLISNLAFLGALFVIYQLAVEYGGEKIAFRTLFYICIFPTSFYFFTSYNESLFLFLSAATVLAARKQRWWLAGSLGFFSAMTRSVGLLLVFPILYEMWNAREYLFAKKWKGFLHLCSLGMIPAGVAVFALYCWDITGDPLTFVKVQAHWSRVTSWPWEGIWRAIHELVVVQPFGSFNQVHILLDLSATLLFISLTIISWFKLRRSYAIWNTVLVLFVLVSPSVGQHDPLISNQRFIIEQFPIFITLAILGAKHPRLHQTIRMISPALLAVLSVLFVMNVWLV